MSYTLLSAPIPFPALGWWAAAAKADAVVIDDGSHFRKMADRNRYLIATAAGRSQLSIPVAGGRNQRKPIREVMIANTYLWQKQHWRTIQSAYGKAPFFEYYAAELQTFYNRPFSHLHLFNCEILQWLWKELRLGIPLSFDLNSISPSAELLDWRNTDPDAYPKCMPKPFAYHQVFEDRHDFLPQLSVLDLLMNEGPTGFGLMVSAI